MMKVINEEAVWQQLLPPANSRTATVRIDMATDGNMNDKNKPTTLNIVENKGTNNDSRNQRSSGKGFWNWSPRETFRQHSTVSSSLSTDTAEASIANKSPTSKTNSSSLTRYRTSRWSSRRVRKRVVMKNGECNVVQTNVAKRRRRYLADIFTTMVDIQWRWTVLIFTLSFMLSWLAFAVIWWLIAFTHGDLEAEHLPDRQEESKHKPCVANIWNFASCFLFSIETQHTIGYGYRYSTEECPEAIFVQCIQSIIGVMIQAYMVGVVFSKLTRPKMRAQTLMFSRNAVICQRDGQLCLMFRVGDMRKSHIIAAHIRAQMIRSRVTAEGEQMPYYQHELKVGVDLDETDIFFIWPMTIVHKITPDSPLYNISASDLLKEKFEIVVILEGTIESTSMTTQARSSYLPSEILWGHRFEPLVSFRKDSGKYAVDYGLFNNTYEVDTPLCSSRDLDEFKKLREENQHNGIQLKARQVPTSPMLQHALMAMDPTLMNANPLMRAVSPLSLAPVPLSISQPNMNVRSVNKSAAIATCTTITTESANNQGPQSAA